MRLNSFTSHQKFKNLLNPFLCTYYHIPFNAYKNAFIDVP